MAGEDAWYEFKFVRTVELSLVSRFLRN